MGMTGSAARVGESVGNGLGSARVGVEDTGRACAVTRVEGAVDVAVAVAGGLGEGGLVAVGAGGCVGIKVGTALGGAGRCVGIELGTGLGGAGLETVGDGPATGLFKA